ncbi:MAG: DUF4469 domain-containing protein [Anaerolineae bacterium]|nr:DUF4469 domain-containing protein [Anaerolineae bacterium]
MSAFYKLGKPRSNGNSKSYRAGVQYTKVLTEEDIIDMMILEGSPCSKADTQAILEKYYTMINRAACNGWQVVTRNARYGFAIKGDFYSPHDEFDPKRHQIVARIQPGSDYKETVETGVNVKKLTNAKKRPDLDVYANLSVEAQDTELTPGRMACLFGHHLRFDPRDAEQGLFIVPHDDDAITAGSEQDVRVDEVVNITLRELTFIVPNHLQPGNYKLQVRAKYGKNGKSVLRSGELHDILTVA